MIEHTVRVHPSAARLPREAQLAWHLAAFAASGPPIEPAVAKMVASRVLDYVAVALAAIDRRPVAAARAQALAHARPGSGTLIGLPADQAVHAEWAAWANGTAVRELDFHDTFLAADYAHPGDTIPPLVAVAQQCGRDGAALVRAIAVAYEVQVALVKAICLHRHKIDHIAHLAPAVAAGLGSLMDLPVETCARAIDQAVHVSITTRQSRKGEITSWKAYAPAHAAKLAIEAVDRALRGEAAPNPIYEGEDSVIAWLLAGPEAAYTVALPDPGEPPHDILETYTKAHSAEYQAQAIIDLALALRGRIELAQVETITPHTSHHTHTVIGSGANDPQKTDPAASRETLDHSIMYILAVALEDGAWHHETSYPPTRPVGPSTVDLMRRITTVEDPTWTKRYHAADPAVRVFGGRVEVRLTDGTVVRGEKAVADAHPNGARPWGRADYVAKFDALAGARLDAGERDRFIAAAGSLDALSAAAVHSLYPVLQPGTIERPATRGIFDW